MSRYRNAPHPTVLFIAGWLVPGLAHWLLGKRDKAVLFLVLILGTFIAGMALADWRNVYYTSGRWTALTQAPAGVAAFVGTQLRDSRTNPVEEERPMFKIGTLYTSVAALLNLVVLLDAVHVGWMRRTGGR